MKYSEDVLRLNPDLRAAPTPAPRCAECGAVIGKGRDRRHAICAVCAFVDVLRVHAPDLLGASVREHLVAPPRRWAFDLAWPAQRVALEVDGGQWAPRGGRHATDGDREKLNEAAARGWRVLRLSPQQIAADPRAAADVLRRALEVTP